MNAKNLQLCEAVEADDIAAARAALADGAEINARVRIERLYKLGPLAFPAQAPLAWATSVAMAEILLDAGAAIDGKDEHGYTALRRAVINVRSGRMPLVELLLRRGANPNVPLRDAWGGGVELVQKLLEAGAAITADALSYASHDPARLALLREWPIRSAKISDDDKQLMLAARAGDLERVTALLPTANANARDANGLTASDHAFHTGHVDVAMALERAAVAGHDYAPLFLAVLDDMYLRIEKAAGQYGVETHNEVGVTPLMLAARYRRAYGVQALLACGAKADERALVAAIEAGDLSGMRTLLDHHAPMGEASLRTACAQLDTDLLKELLLRGIDIAPYPALLTAHSEADRLLRNARAGRRPPAVPTAVSWRACALCRDLPASMGWHKPAMEDRTGEPLPEVTDQFEIVGYSGRSGIWKCPHCATYYAHDTDHDNGIYDGWDSEDLTRVDDVKALEALRAMTPRPRIEREIAALSARVAFEAAIAAPGRMVFWCDDEVKNGERVVSLYRVGSDGAKRVASRRVPDVLREAFVASLQARGVAAAETDTACDFVWVRTADGLEVYDDTCLRLVLSGDRATLANRVIARGDIARVVTFATDDMIYRGVRAILRSGEEVDLVTDTSSAAMSNASGLPMYSRNELICDTVWCATIAIAVADWAGAAYEDLI